MNFRKPEFDRLSTSQLAALAVGQGVQLHGTLDRNVILAELLEMENEEQAEDAVNPRNALIADPPEEQEIENNHIINSDAKVKIERGRAGEYELAKIPLHYNVSAIYAIVRDPLWVFICWELLTGQRKNLEQHASFKGYVLNVREKNPDTRAYTDVYSISVGRSDTAWYLHFTPSESIFRVELSARLDGTPLVLAVTEDFTLPQMLDTASLPAVDDTLWKLSGINEFNIIKNIGFKRGGLF